MKSSRIVSCHAVYQKRKVLAGGHYDGSCKVEKPWMHNMQFSQGKSWSSSEDFSILRIYGIQAIPEIALGEALLMRYLTK